MSHACGRGFRDGPDGAGGLFVDPGDPLRPEIIALGASLASGRGAFPAGGNAGQFMAWGLAEGRRSASAPPCRMSLRVLALLGPRPARGPGHPAFPWASRGPAIWAGLVRGLAVSGALMNDTFLGAAGPASPRCAWRRDPPLRRCKYGIPPSHGVRASGDATAAQPSPGAPRSGRGPGRSARAGGNPL